VVVKEADLRAAVRKVLMRCLIAYLLIKAAYPGTLDEKMACEVGVYVYIKDNCPDILIARLIGFGFLDGRKVL
jgi:hypothetical protein